MLLIQLRDEGDVRRFMFCWGGLTSVYVGAVLYRLFALHQPPGLPTYAGFSAVGAVWLFLIDAVYPRGAFRLGAITSLFASVTLNIVLIIRAVVAGRAIPVARSLFTLLLLFCLLTATLQELYQLDHKEKE